MDARDHAAAGGSSVSDPVVYTVTIGHWYSGEVDVVVKDIGSSQSDRAAVVHALLIAANQVAVGLPRDRVKLS
jgi:hypothetical protein